MLNIEETMKAYKEANAVTILEDAEALTDQIAQARIAQTAYADKLREEKERAEYERLAVKYAGAAA